MLGRYLSVVKIFEVVKTTEVYVKSYVLDSIIIVINTLSVMFSLKILKWNVNSDIRVVFKDKNSKCFDKRNEQKLGLVWTFCSN